LRKNRPAIDQPQQQQQYDMGAPKMEYAAYAGAPGAGYDDREA
jgi:hypothetical protein